ERRRMRRTRRSLFYLTGYLTLTGAGMIVAPDALLKMLFSTRDYGDVFPRFAGILMVALGLIVAQVIRHRAEQLYPATLAVRGVIWVSVAWLYLYSRDPFFLVVLAVVALGMLITGLSYMADRREQRG
ncbi:MAG: hypothetical protein ACRD8O_01625, partial [Bryobacteraceae bacterium]